MEEKEIKELAEKLSDENSDMRMGAAGDLRDAAKKGVDISIAILPLVDLLCDGSYYVRWSVARALGEAATNKKTKELVLKLLIEKLSDENQAMREGAIEALKNALENNADISIAIPALEEVLSGNDMIVGDHAKELLIMATLNEEIREIVLELLVEKLSGKRWSSIVGAAKVLSGAAGRGIDISIAIPALGETLFIDDHTTIRTYVIWALESAAKNGADLSIIVPALGEVLSDSGRDIRNKSAEFLRGVAGDCKSKEELLELLRKIKGSPEAKEVAKGIYETWIRERNEKIELQKQKMRKPEKPDRKKLRKALN
ncbi:HEAT repeat domain-containing protein [Candidatus Micrarchaeota archaeon]|nr:HEAT repeat domain-containing protein [Candidatus Micrarchaeota archaeon]